MVEHFYVKFDDAGCSGFRDIVRINRQTSTDKMPTPRQLLLTAVIGHCSFPFINKLTFISKWSLYRVLLSV